MSYKLSLILIRFGEYHNTLFCKIRRYFRIPTFIFHFYPVKAEFHYPFIESESNDCLKSHYFFTFICLTFIND